MLQQDEVVEEVVVDTEEDIEDVDVAFEVDVVVIIPITSLFFS